MGIGTSSPLSHAKLHVNGTLFLGDGSGLLDGTLGGCIDFESRDSGAYGSSNYSSALIGTRTHHYSTVVPLVNPGNPGADDKMEMVFFIGNNPTSSYGPDRFSFIGGEFRIHTPSSTYTPTLKGWACLDEMGLEYEDSIPAFIVDGGRVGIGTDSPLATLNVTNNLPSGAGTSGNTTIPSNYGGNSTTTCVLGHGVTGSTPNYFGLNIGTIYSGKSYFQACNNNGGSYDLLLNPNGGYVGIGTDSPGSALHVKTSSAYRGILLDDENGLIFKVARGAGTSSPYLNLYTSNGTVGTVSIQSNGNSFFNGGNVGIGTTTPAAGLHVTAGTNGAIGTAGYLASNGTTSTYAYGTKQLAIKTENGHIWSSGGFSVVVTSSDKRIKTDIVSVPDNLSLGILRKLDCVYYSYIDKKGNGKTIGWLAQDVKEHFPIAVSIQQEDIPNEMRKLENLEWEEVVVEEETTYKLINHGLEECEYRFYVKKDASSNEIRVSLDYPFLFKEKYEEIFCYGKRVYDFLTIDKAKIQALSYSALQEIDKIQQAEKTKLAEQTTKLEASEAKITSLETTVANLLARITALENP